MPIEFKLSERLIGFTTTGAEKGEWINVSFRELLAPRDDGLVDRLERLQGALFGHIPGLPEVPQIDHLLVILRPDLTATAYVNELHMKMKVKPIGAFAKGTLLYKKDIADITAVEIGIEIPADSAFVLVRSFGWRRSLYYDFGPLQLPAVLRDYSVERALAQQALALLDIPSANPRLPERRTRLDHMAAGLDGLKKLLAGKCTDEAPYQELLQAHPWMLAGSYSALFRHQKFDDENIPDFTAVRCHDDCHDIIELKQPFLTWFRQDGEFAADFNDAWGQAESYLAFAHEQRVYLREKKHMRFENPRCTLLLGYNLTEANRVRLQQRESMSRLITVLTYDQLLRTAEHVYDLVKRSGHPIKTGTASAPDGVDGA